MNFFRDLTEDEEKEFRKYARNTFDPTNTEIKSTWHPIIKDECMLMINEMNDEKDNKE